MTTVAVIDDQALMRDMMAVALRRQGFQVIAAANGREALQKLADVKVDVVVTDIFMPEADGIEVLRELRRRDPDMPVIAVSGGSLQMPGDFLRMASVLGAARTLSKPFRPDELVEAVRTLAAARQAPPAPG